MYLKWKKIISAFIALLLVVLTFGTFSVHAEEDTVRNDSRIYTEAMG